MKRVAFLAQLLLFSVANAQLPEDFGKYGVYEFNGYYGFRGASGEVVFPLAAFVRPEFFTDQGLKLEESTFAEKRSPISQMQSNGLELQSSVGLVFSSSDDIHVVFQSAEKSKSYWNVEQALAFGFRSEKLGSDDVVLKSELKGILDGCLEVAESTGWSSYMQSLWLLYEARLITEKEFFIKSSPFLLECKELINGSPKAEKMESDSDLKHIDVNFNAQFWSQVTFLIRVHPNKQVIENYGTLLLWKDQLEQCQGFTGQKDLAEHLTRSGLADMTEEHIGFFRSNKEALDEISIEKSRSGAFLRKVPKGLGELIPSI